MKNAGETVKTGAEEELRRNFQAEGLHSDETPESRIGGTDEAIPIRKNLSGKSTERAQLFACPVFS